MLQSLLVNNSKEIAKNGENKEGLRFLDNFRIYKSAPIQEGSLSNSYFSVNDNLRRKLDFSINTFHTFIGWNLAEFMKIQRTAIVTFEKMMLILVDRSKS